MAFVNRQRDIQIKRHDEESNEPTALRLNSNPDLTGTFLKHTSRQKQRQPAKLVVDLYPRLLLSLLLLLE